MFGPLQYLPWLAACLLLASCGGGSGTNTADIRINCLGAGCDASKVENYSNTAAQIWTFSNTSDTPVTVDLNFSNLATGQEVAYVFGNGYSAAVSAPPAAGQAVGADGNAAQTIVGSSSQADKQVRNSLQEMQDEWRQLRHDREADLVRLLRTNGGAASSGAGSGGGSGSPISSPSAGNSALLSPLVTQRSWTDSFSDTSASYLTSYRSSCLTGDGRRVVTWADDSSVQRNIASSQAIAAFEATLCGTNGAVSRMSQLIGNVWGTVSDPRLIRDTPASPLDINVVIFSAGKDKGWAGYFYGGDTFSKSARSESNEALAFYVNADYMADDLLYTQSLLIHELTHMVFWYQRVIARDAPPHDTWLNEMAALMSEDIITPALVTTEDQQPYRPMLSYRLLRYLNSGGGLDLLGWAQITKANPYYSMAAAFGAFLNRQYGLAIYKGLVSECLNIDDGWACLDAVIKKNGGKGVDDDFNRFGLAVFGLSDPRGPSSRYGFPNRVEEGYVLAGVDLSAYGIYRPWRSPSFSRWSTGMHSYFLERAAVSLFSLTRRGITVPPRSRLNIMIRQGSGS